MTKIVIKQENVDKGTLDDLIQALEKATGCTIKWSMVHELEVDDPKVAAVLETVFSGTHETKKPEKKARGGKRERVVKNKWHVMDGLHAGEVLVTQKANKMAANGELQPGTRLHHPKMGDRFVSNGKLIEEPVVSPTRFEFKELVPA